MGGSYGPRSEQKSQGAARSTGSMGGGALPGHHLAASYNGPVLTGIGGNHPIPAGLIQQNNPMLSGFSQDK